MMVRGPGYGLLGLDTILGHQEGLLGLKLDWPYPYLPVVVMIVLESRSVGQDKAGRQRTRRDNETGHVTGRSKKRTMRHKLYG
jgi:hypothetical protein